MIPVDATIWKEANDFAARGDQRPGGVDAVKDFGACAKLVVLDASRRDPDQRRFRAFSHGLAPMIVPDKTVLTLTSASPGAVADDSAGANSGCW